MGANCDFKLEGKLRGIDGARGGGYLCGATGVEEAPEAGTVVPERDVFAAAEITVAATGCDAAGAITTPGCADVVIRLGV